MHANQPGYVAGQTVRRYRTVDPHDDRGRTVVYLEPAGGGERRYLAPLSAGELRDEVVDSRVLPEKASVARSLSAAHGELAWEGEAPERGLWQFVLEPRPGPAREGGEEPALMRRAWARFVVAERNQLLNRSGSDREIRADMTVRSDTIYYVGHQLFVHDGATLTIEPGTLVRPGTATPRSSSSRAAGSSPRGLGNR